MKQLAPACRLEGKQHMSDPERWKRLLHICGPEDLERIRALREAVQNTLTAQLSTSDMRRTVSSLNELHDTLQTKVLKIAENKLARQGLGAPPVPYAYLLFGSGGRSEQTTISDQDNGIVYADPVDEESAEQCRRYFNRLAETVVHDLELLGYPPCEGNVVASNKSWCLSVDEWKNKMDGWFDEPSWESVRYLLIMADARPAAGDITLAAKLKDHYFKQVDNRPAIAGRMIENTLRHKVLVGFFGQLLPERYGADAGSLDIKYGAYIPMVNAFRLLAVQAGIRETGTLNRIDGLRQAGVLTAAEAEQASEAFTFILKLRTMASVVKLEGQTISPGKLTADRLTKELIVPLKKALKTGRKMQLMVQRKRKERFGGRSEE